MIISISDDIMGFRGKVNDDVIGHKPSSPSRTEYGVANYEDFSKKSKKKSIPKLNYYLNELLDNDIFIENLIYFDDKKYISIEYDENYISTPNFEKSFNLNEFNEIWEYIKLKNENHIFDYGFSNIYIGFGLIEYADYSFPLFFIPINFVENDSNVKFYLNENLNISFNYCLKDELYKFNFPNVNENFIEFIDYIENINEIRYLRKAYIGNFNLNTINCCNDLNYNWSNSLNKFDLFFNNKYFFEPYEVIDLNNKLATKWPDLDFKLYNLNLSNVNILIKNLLDDGNNILFVSDKFQRKFIKKGLELSYLDDLILDYDIFNENDNAFELVNDEYSINTNDMVEFSKLNEELSELEDLCDALNNNYSQLELNPRDIKRFKDKYYDKVKDISNDFPIKNATTYKSSYINKLKNQLISVIENEEFKNRELYLNEDFFNSNEYKIFKNIFSSFEHNLNSFIEINNQINEIYGIKKFKNLYEVKFLDNILVLNKFNLFIDKQDRSEINNFLKLELNSMESINKDKIELILDKYQIDKKNINTIENHVKYTELIDFNIFNDELLIKNNLAVIKNDLKILCNINSYLLKQIDYIDEFYGMFKCFETPEELFDSKKTIENVNNLITIFKQDFNKLKKFAKNTDIDVTDSNVKNYIKLWKSGKINKDLIGHVFSYNLYNSVLNSFLDDFENIDEEHILTSYYNDRYEEVYLKIKDKEVNQFKQSIYLKLKELNQNNHIKKQKKDWNLKISKGESIPNNKLLTDYKDYIFSNKRIFMINIELIPIVLDQTFENYFDYVLICSKDDIDAIYNLPVFLRTKNKLIDIPKGER